MTWVKICGTTNSEDALEAVNAGADALGFVFYDRSPRRVEADAVREIVKQLPESIEKVGVFVDQTPAQIRAIVERASLTAVQLHGERLLLEVVNTPGSTREVLAADKLILVLAGDRLSDGFFLGAELKKRLYAILLDSVSNATPGGTGLTFDWQKTRGAAQGLSLMVPVIIAGGLNPSNVTEAMTLFRPFGVDVVSGVEARPGKKDPQKVRAFVQAVRRADKSA